MHTPLKIEKKRKKIYIYIYIYIYIDTHTHRHTIGRKSHSAANNNSLASDEVF